MATKERPILFGGPMVRAILEGRKTQTRRIIKPQPTPTPVGGLTWPSPNGLKFGGSTLLLDNTRGRAAAVEYCPYGRPGDRLWVRETWALVCNWGEDGLDDVGGTIPVRPPAFGQVWYKSGHPWESDCMEDRGFRWRSPIHMPRWASRITLEVTCVRVERLHEISEADAIAEGALEAADVPYNGSLTCSDAKLAFRNLWSDINGPDSWDANPWVWVVEFRRVEA